MKITINPEVLCEYPDFTVAFARVDNVGDYASPEERLEAQATIVRAVNRRFPSPDTIESHYLAHLYSDFYKSMGLNPKKVSTPAKQALRVVTNQNYRSIYKAIDLCMSVEYTTLVSFQIYDWDKIKGDLSYRFSEGSETLVDFHNEKKTTKVGELVLADNKALLHSVYYGNNAERSVDAGTQRFLIRVMGIPGMRHEDFDVALRRLAEISPQVQLLQLSRSFPVGDLL